MMSFLTYITGFFMNFEILPILTDYAQHAHLPSAEGFLPPKLKGLSICRGTKLRKKQQLYPSFKTHWAPCVRDHRTVLECGHPGTIPPKFGSNWPSGFRGVD
jgi:hypothetical protein